MPEKFFDQNQFLLADSSYTSDWFTLPAYKGKKLLLKFSTSDSRGLRKGGSEMRQYYWIRTKFEKKRIVKN
ncbi:hypothetical protein VP01_4014g1 [Puccinia sorghi]|uniref:DDE Tnp4 domain-containing protein n=1 Tax=Puccinia sorghi TaxID=27349 RepID=A0A0L6URV8_9BASI|nr:hypothetical protein VP01_4014g1 [Puccinia sorghi]